MAHALLVVHMCNIFNILEYLHYTWGSMADSLTKTEYLARFTLVGKFGVGFYLYEVSLIPVTSVFKRATSGIGKQQFWVSWCRSSPSGVHVDSISNRSVIDLGSIGDRSGIYLGSFWTRSGIDLRSVWDRSSIDLGLIWNRSRIYLESIWDTFGNDLE